MAGDAEQPLGSDIYQAAQGKPDPYQIAAIQALGTIVEEGFVEDSARTIRIMLHAASYITDFRKKYPENKVAIEEHQRMDRWFHNLCARRGVKRFDQVRRIRVDDVNDLWTLLESFRNRIDATRFFFKKHEDVPEPAVLEMPLEIVIDGWKILVKDGIVSFIEGANRSGKSNLASYICRWLAQLGYVVVISNLAFIPKRTLERYPNLEYTVFDSGMLARVAQEKIKHGGKMKFLWMYDEADAFWNTQNRQGDEIKNAGIFLKQMGKFGMAACFIFKNERHIPPEYQRDRSKNKLPGGAVGYYLHMGAYPQMDPFYGTTSIGYYRNRWQRQSSVLLENAEGELCPTINGIPNEAPYYWTAMPCTTVHDISWAAVMKDLQDVDLPADTQPSVIDQWHRDLGYMVLDRLPHWRVDGAGLARVRQASVLRFTNDYYERLIKIGKGSWERAARKVDETYHLEIEGPDLKEKWQSWRENIVPLREEQEVLV